MTTRRAFVGDAAKALAGLALFHKGDGGPVRILPASAIRGGATAATLFAPEMHAVDLHALVGPALDAAKSAGASFADIRVAIQTHLQILPDPLDDTGVMDMRLDSNFSYGIRVLVDGAFAFIHGCVPDRDRITRAAQDAVATAKGMAKLQAGVFELAPAAPVSGEWTTPIKTDPFNVPLADQVNLLNTYRELYHRMLGSGPRQGQLFPVCDWTKDYRVYGSTDGSLTTQSIYRFVPRLLADGQRTFLPGASNRPLYFGTPVAGGYETVLNPALPDALKEAAETAERWSQLPIRRLPVGRYSVVMDGGLLGPLFSATVGDALQLDRALGFDTDSLGGSFLARPDEVLGKRLLNPLLNVTADRTAPHIQAVKWDDDGVEPQAYQILKDGVVVDYHTSRQTAPALAKWYQAQGTPARSHGCAVATEAQDPVVVRTPHLTVAPARENTSLDDLCKDVKHGLLIRNGGDAYPYIDQDLASGLLDGQMFEVVNGKVVGRVKNAAVQFKTLSLWKNLTALGGERTVDGSSFRDDKGFPWSNTISAATAPAGLFKDLDVVNLGLMWASS